MRKWEWETAMGAVLARFSKRFRRLVVSLCKARLPLLESGKSDRGLPEVGVLSVDFRPARPGGRPEFELMTQRLASTWNSHPCAPEASCATPSALACIALRSDAAAAGSRGKQPTIRSCSAPTRRYSG